MCVQKAAVCIRDGNPAIENEIVLRTTTIDRKNMDAVLACEARHRTHLSGMLAHDERTGAGGHDHITVFLDELSDWIDLVLGMLLDISSLPEIFTDQKADAMSGMFDPSTAASGKEVPIIIKHVVARQQPLVGPGLDATTSTDGQTVETATTVGIPGMRTSHKHQHVGWQRGGKVIQNLLAAFHEPLPEQQIARRISTERKLWGQQHITVRAGMGKIGDETRIGLDITGPGIQMWQDHVHSL